MVHDTSRGSQDKVTELTGWEKVVDPGFDILLFDVESWRDDTSLVDTTNQLDDNLARTVIIDDFKFSNIT